jgi:predicted permease
MTGLRAAFSALGGDLRYALLASRSRPWFTVMVVATMAVGIGTTVGAFAFLSYFTRPTLDAPAEERVAWIHAVTGEGSAPGTSCDDFRDLEAGARDVAESTAGWRFFASSLQGPASTRMAWGHAVSGGYFGMFGARPHLGRLIGPADDRPGAEPVVVLSHLTWTGQFAADPNVVGRSVLLNGKLRFTVVGVAQKGFQGEGIWTGIYVPIATAGSLVAGDREVLALVRLSPGITLEQADARLAGLARTLDEARPLGEGVRQLRLVPVTAFDPSWSGDPLYAAARVLMVAVSLLLLLACANIANLQLARGAARRRDLAVHAALGAGRFRLASRLGLESLLLSFAGGAFGLLLARGLTGLIEQYLRREIPISMGDWAAGTTLTLDESEIALFFAAASMVSGLLFGVAPVLQTVRTDLVAALKGGAATGRAGWRARNALLVIQVALSIVLLVGASLLVRTLQAARAVDVGFDDRGLVLATVFAPRERLGGDGARPQSELLAAVRELPGVESASLVQRVPLTLGTGRSKVAIGGARSEINTNVVGEGFFETLGVRLVEGRGFMSTDTAGAPHVAVVNRAAAERFWSGRSPLGQRLAVHERGFGQPGDAHVVVGVVEDSRYEPAAPAIQPLAYLPFSQHPRTRMTFIVRTRAPIGGPFHDLLRTRYPDLAVVGVVPFAQQRQRSLANQEMNAELSAGVALLGVLFAVVGVFGVVSYTVAQRTREIGLRMAIGAGRRDVRLWALKMAARPVGWGVAIGLPAAFGLGVLLESQLVGVGSRDPVTFVAVPVVLTGVALLAAWLPARRATLIEPATALRNS